MIKEYPHFRVGTPYKINVLLDNSYSYIGCNIPPDPFAVKECVSFFHDNCTLIVIPLRTVRKIEIYEMN